MSAEHQAEFNRRLAALDIITPEMWSAGRTEFEKHARAYNEAPGYEIASAIADRAGEAIYNAMREAAA